MGILKYVTNLSLLLKEQSAHLGALFRSTTEELLKSFQERFQVEIRGALIFLNFFSKFLGKRVKTLLLCILALLTFLLIFASGRVLGPVMMVTNTVHITFG